MLNKVQIIGRLGKPVELRYTQSGTAIGQMTIATDESYNDREGNKISQTEWHRVVTFGKTAENCNSFLAKGSLVYVEGRLKTRKWQDRDGNDRYTTEINADRIAFLERRQEERQEQPSSYNPKSHFPPETDDVPF